MTEVLACLAHHDVQGTAYRVPDRDGVMVWHALPEAEAPTLASETPKGGPAAG